MIQPTALNVLIIGLSSLIFFFIWRLAAGHLVERNADSKLGKAMASVNS